MLSPVFLLVIVVSFSVFSVAWVALYGWKRRRDTISDLICDIFSFMWAVLMTYMLAIESGRFFPDERTWISAITFGLAALSSVWVCYKLHRGITAVVYDITLRLKRLGR
jgi:hypothetical protein